MCTGLEPAAIAGIAASAAGTGISMNAQHQAEKKQEREAATNVRTQSEFNRKAGARVSQEVERLKASDSKPEEQAAENDFMAALRKAQVTNTGAEPQGAVSERFAQDQGTAEAENAAGNRGAAHSLARIDAPFLQRVREGAGAGRTASELSVLRGEASGQDFLSQLRASLIKPNPGAMAAGSLLSAGGNAYASRAVPVKKPVIFSQLPNQVPNYGVPS